MISLKEYINESIAAQDVLIDIQKLLRKYLIGRSFTIDIKEIVGYDQTGQLKDVYGFDNKDDLMADIAGYLVEVFVWNELRGKLFSDPKFKSKWLKDIDNASKNIKNIKSEFRPIVRRSQKGKYWDFTLPGVEGYFEIKARSVRGGRSGGFRYTENQIAHKDELIFILVHYNIEGSSICISNIELKDGKKL